MHAIGSERTRFYTGQKYQTFHYTRVITPKGVMSLQAHLCAIALGQHRCCRRKIITVAWRCQQCVRFDLPKI